MRRLLALFAATAMTLAAASALATEWKIDNSHTAANFSINHLGTSTTHGRFNKISGSFTTDNAWAINVTIDAKSIDSNDAKRDKHLRGPDFFDVKQFPTLSFTSTAWKKTGDKTWDVTGQITIHGITKSITIPITKVGQGKDPWGGIRAGFDTTFKINRADFGMNYMPGGLGNEVTITFAVEGIQKK